MTKMRQIQLLMNAARLLSDSNICRESPRDLSHWWEIVKFAHRHGYLYLGFDGPDVDLVAVGYRVPYITENLGKEFPLIDKGEVLYVPLVASSALDRLKLLRMLRFYLKRNPNVHKVAYHYRGNNDWLKTFEIRRPTHVKK